MTETPSSDAPAVVVGHDGSHAADDALFAVVDEAVASVREWVPAATGTAVRRSGSTALLQAAGRLVAAADLLVVGSRGRGGFTGLVLGSTSDQVSRHASCTVVVLRAQDHPVEPAAGDDA